MTTLRFILLAAAIFATAFAAPASGKASWLRFPLSELFSPKSSGDGKIIGGIEVTPNSLPFVVMLERRGSSGTWSFSGGGSILESNLILTSASAVEGYDPANLKIIAGLHRRSEPNANVQIGDIATVTIHPQYNNETLENDIALLALLGRLTLDSAVNTIRLPTAGENPVAGTLMTVAGWGLSSPNGNNSDVLLSAVVPVVSDANCQRDYEGIMTIDANSMLCAGFQNGAADACAADEGQGLFTGSGNQVTIHGVVSRRDDCAQPSQPGIYAQVGYFVDWINANRP